MLKSAFNALLAIHSRPAQLVRKEEVSYYSACRISPSNFFRFLRGPEQTTIHGREFIISKESMTGHFAQSVSFNASPQSGVFKFGFDEEESIEIQFNDSAEIIEEALRDLEGLENINVSGSIEEGLLITFIGFPVVPSLLTIEDSTLVDSDLNPVTANISNTLSPWSDPILKGDKIIDSVYKYMTIDEIIEMVDVGGEIIGYRVRAE